MTDTMIRRLISLTTDDYAWLRERARELGVTVTDLVRMLVRQERAQQTKGHGR